MSSKFLAGSSFLIFFFTLYAATQAATFTVTRSDDRNMTCVAGVDNCSLREAMKAANNAAGNDLINFDAGVTSIQLTGALPEITSVISIQGGSGVTVIGDKANSTFRPFLVSIMGVGNLTMDRITVVDGKEFVGGGIWNRATATLTNCTFSGNEATGDAGGIYNTGTMTISNSVISVNSAVFNGGGIRNGGTLTIIESTVGFNSSDQPGSTLANSNGGGIHNGGFLTIVRSSVSGNITAGNGGGIHNSAVSAVRIINSTISFNSAFQGNGGGVYDVGAETTLTNVTVATNFASFASGYWNNDFRASFLRNTIIANNDGGSTAPDVFGLFGNSFNNLIGKADGSTGLVNGANGNIVGTVAVPVNPQLNALANNGGATQTHSFSSNTSPAINAGNNALALNENNQPLTTDQRGTGFPRVKATTVDIGAYESSPPTAASVSVGGRVLTARGRGIFRARVSMVDSSGTQRNVYTNPFGYYNFGDVPAGETYVFSVSHRRYNFAAQILSLVEERDDVNFVALP